MEESGFRFLLLVSTYFVSAGWSNWYEHFEAISSGGNFLEKALKVLQGACLKQMATSQLTGKVPSQGKGLWLKRERDFSAGKTGEYPNPNHRQALDSI